MHEPTIHAGAGGGTDVEATHALPFHTVPAKS